MAAPILNHQFVAKYAVPGGDDNAAILKEILRSNRDDNP
jgi:hypothetical protein